MTTAICTRLPGGGIESITAEGHTGYDEEGSDIVCAAISVLMQTAALALEEECGIPSTVSEELTRITLSLPKGNTKTHEAQLLLRTAWRGLRAIAEQYPDYVSTQEV